MAHVLGQGGSSRLQQSSPAVIEKIPPPCTEKNLIFQDGHKVGHPFVPQYLAPNCEPRQNASTKQVVHSKSSEKDELVKHMSNLPGFLQQVKKENSIQEKALNFGVLDWKRLEHWKYNERMPGKYPKKTSSTSNSFSPTRGPPKMVPNLRKQSSSHGPNPSSLYTGKQPMPHGSRFSSPSRQPPPRSFHLHPSKEERNATHDKKEKYVNGMKSEGKETFNQEFQAAKSSTIDDFQPKVEINDRNKTETNMDSIKRKEPKKVLSKKETSSSERGKHKFSPSSDCKINAQGKKREMRLNNEVNFTSSECYPPDPQNIELLVPKHFQKLSCSQSSQRTESRTSFDGQLAEEIGNNRLSDFFSPEELYSGELSVDIPHSCPLPTGAMKPQNTDSVNSIVSEGKCSMVHEKTSRTSSSEAPHKTADFAKARPPSPTRRFSFNLGRMSRSFSFKESSEVPQLSSTYTTVKSGPVRPEASSAMEKFEIDKANASSRGRSSPLRRLLDPLLKYKGAQSSEPVRKAAGSTVQALLQLNLKNGMPFFKLVVDNSNDMLAAVMKRLPTSGKVDPCMIYTFYSIHEIRKRSMTWMSQVSKSKNCNLGYNIVGQMNISRSCHGKVNRIYSGECDARDCVLYGVDPEFGPNKEIAAIVVKNPSEKLNDGLLIDDTVVILPGGVHGIPIKGAPSSLITRWISRGSCDCGGWDVGCKLRILTDCNSTSASDRVNLFVQGGEKKGKPVFSLEPFSNGFYSIELDASISLLEAFATSVAYITCRKFPEIIDSEARSDAEYFPETITEADKMKTSTLFQREIPPKYVTCPPLSPAGRI